MYPPLSIQSMLNSWALCVRISEFAPLSSHLFDGAVLRLRWPYSPLIEEVQGDEERGTQGSHGGGQGDGDVPEENHICVERTGPRPEPESR